MVGGGLSANVGHPRQSTRSRWVGRASVLGGSAGAGARARPDWLKHLALTVAMLGLQLVWSCEMSQASPYLLSLGVSKASMAIVFLAGELVFPRASTTIHRHLPSCLTPCHTGPLSGLIVQPVVGVLSDRCRSTLGRRRPFIIAGTIASSFAILLLGWSKEVASILTLTGSSAVSRDTPASETNNRPTAHTPHCPCSTTD